MGWSLAIQPPQKRLAFGGVGGEDAHEVLEGFARRGVAALGEDDDQVADRAQNNIARVRGIQKLFMEHLVLQPRYKLHLLYFLEQQILELTGTVQEGLRKGQFL